MSLLRKIPFNIIYFIVISNLLIGCRTQFQQAPSFDNNYRVGLYINKKHLFTREEIGILAFFNSAFFNTRDAYSLDGYVPYSDIRKLKQDFNEGALDVAIAFSYNISAVNQMGVFLNPLTLSYDDKNYIYDALKMLGVGNGVSVSYWKSN